jgi:hypothetical protein
MPKAPVVGGSIVTAPGCATIPEVWPSAYAIDKRTSPITAKIRMFGITFSFSPDLGRKLIQGSPPVQATENGVSGLV